MQTDPRLCLLLQMVPSDQIEGTLLLMIKGGVLGSILKRNINHEGGWQEPVGLKEIKLKICGSSTYLLHCFS